VTPEQQLIAGLLAAIQGGILFGVRYLITERTKEQAACNERIGKLEARLDEGAATMRRLNDVLQKQVDAHELTITRLTASERRQS
jgi:uncharacterized coiled-coil protein SlyX